MKGDGRAGHVHPWTSRVETWEERWERLRLGGDWQKHCPTGQKELSNRSHREHNSQFYECGRTYATFMPPFLLFHLPIRVVCKTPSISICLFYVYTSDLVFLLWPTSRLGGYETQYCISCRNLLEDIVNYTSLAIGSSHMINSFKDQYDFRGSTNPLHLLMLPAYKFVHSLQILNPLSSSFLSKSLSLGVLKM